MTLKELVKVNVTSHTSAQKPNSYERLSITKSMYSGSQKSVNHFLNFTLTDFVDVVTAYQFYKTFSR